MPWLQGAVRTTGRLNVDTAVRCAGRPRVWVEAPAPGFEARAGEELAISVIATTCAEAGGVSAHVEVNGLPVTLTPRGDGVYTGSYYAERGRGADCAGDR